MGFFQASTLLQTSQPIQRAPRCGECGLLNGCQTPKMPLHGEGRRGILIVGEAPGRQEDEQGVPFVGDSGQLLRERLRGLNVDMRRDCWVTNALICRPPQNKISTPKQVDCCRPNVFREIETHQPRVIILLGGSAIRSVIGRLWREDVGGVERWVGWQIPSQVLNAWICPTYHPAYLLRQNMPVLDLWFTRHLEQAVHLSQRAVPHTVLPKVRTISTAGELDAWVDQVICSNRMTAVDYETNMLKPDRSEAEIICCAISTADEAVVFLWNHETAEVFSKYARSRCPKIGANIKFEDRWTRAVLGHRVKGWLWDTMLAAHVLDGRPGITSVKFQAFVQFGHSSYDDHIKPFLRSRPNEVNRIRLEIAPHDLLRYCAVDAAVEYLIAQKQMERMGYATGD